MGVKSMRKEDNKPERAIKHDLYDTLWPRRDFEISHLWQISIFPPLFKVFLTKYFNKIKEFQIWDYQLIR